MWLFASKMSEPQIKRQPVKLHVQPPSPDFRNLHVLNISPSDPDIKSFILHIEGVTGDIVFDESADRQPDFALWHYNKSLDEFTTWAEIKVYNPPNQVRIL